MSRSTAPAVTPAARGGLRRVGAVWLLPRDWSRVRVGSIGAGAAHDFGVVGSGRWARRAGAGVYHGAMSAAPYPPDPAMLDSVLRHLSRIDIDLDELEVEAEAALPRTSDALGERAQKVTRTLRLADHPELEAAVRGMVKAVHAIFRRPDANHDASRCDRCVKADCCSFELILTTQAEAARILEFLGEPPSARSRHFVEQRDIGEYYDLHIRHERGRCRFLKKVGSQMRCSIYAVRPQVCREFDAGACTMWSEMLPV